MSASFFDLIISVFDTALRHGFSTLMVYAIPLLGALAIIRFYITMAPVLASGAGLGDALGACLWTLLIIGVYYYLLINLEKLLDAALNSFLTWGLAPGGSTFALGDFLVPSRLIRVGWVASMPIRELIGAMGWGKAAPWNWPTLLIFTISFLAIFVAFVILAVEVMIALIEFRFAAMVSAVLVPWGILTQTAFFAEMSIAWVVGGLIRMLIMASLVGITMTLFSKAVLMPGEDPGISEALLMACVAGLFAALSMIIPKRASSIGGRGMAMALGAGDVFGPLSRHAPAMSAMSASVIRGVSTIASRVGGSSSNGGGGTTARPTPASVGSRS